MFQSPLILLLMQSFVTVSLQQNEAKEFLDDYNKKLIEYGHARAKASFTKAVNVTDFNIQQESLATDRYRVQVDKVVKKARTFNLTGSNDDTKRQFKLLLKTKISANSTIAEKSEDLLSEMEAIYGTTTISFNSSFIKVIQKEDSLTLGQLIDIMAKSNDHEELLYVWKNWRKATSSRLHQKFETYVKLNNIGARENGFRDAGEFYRSFYDVDDLKAIVEDFLMDMQPFYTELHGFVRHQLLQLYPNLVDPAGPIPAHLLGSIWAQHWGALYNRIIPYPQEPHIDVTPTLKKKKTVVDILKMAEEFFMSLGWRKLPKTFWERSVFEKPKDRQMQCYPSAYDLSGKICGEPDVRIKMCMEISQTDFATIHHEMGHIYYYLFYWNQPLEYRAGANPGFQEAIGDFINLSVQTPAHLKTVGLLKKSSQTKEADINFLLKMALENISFMPFSFVMDKWMWNVYSGDIKPSEYNSKWWEYRERYQGIKNPVESSMTDVDPLAKFHIPADVSYIRYFFARILKFMFHKRACDVANNTKPLHQCSIYNSKEVGESFGKMLALGSSKPWPEALKQFTGSDKISVEPVKEYFRPLTVWLKDYREKHRYQLGWNENSGGVATKPGSFMYLIFTFIICSFIY